MKTTFVAAALAAAVAGAQAGMNVTKPDLLEKALDKVIPEKLLPDLPQKINASVTFKTITIPKVVPDFQQMEKDLIEKIDILKPDLDLPKELPEMHKEKKLDEILTALQVVADKKLAASGPGKFYNIDQEITKLYAQVRDYKNAKYKAQGKKVETAVVDSIKNTKVVTIDAKHPNKTALVAEVHAAVGAVKAGLTKPLIEKKEKAAPTRK